MKTLKTKKIPKPFAKKIPKTFLNPIRNVDQTCCRLFPFWWIIGCRYYLLVHKFILGHTTYVWIPFPSLPKLLVVCLSCHGTVFSLSLLDDMRWPYSQNICSLDMPKKYLDLFFNGFFQGAKSIFVPPHHMLLLYFLSKAWGMFWAKQYATATVAEEIRGSQGGPWGGWRPSGGEGMAAGGRDDAWSDDVLRGTRL